MLCVCVFLVCSLVCVLFICVVGVYFLLMFSYLFYRDVINVFSLFVLLCVSVCLLACFRVQ